MPHRTEAVHVLAPLGRDATYIASLLGEAGLNPDIIANLGELPEKLGESTGAVVLTEEAVFGQNWAPVVAALARQPSWSSYPFVFIVSNRTRPITVQTRLPAEISNVMLLERPMGSESLVSAVRWALGSRRRQFVTRDHLRELEQNAVRQQLLTRELAHRVKNTIAVLQSIVSQTMRKQPGLQDVEKLLVDRFSALARAHDLLLSTDFQRSNFAELLRTTLSVHVLDEARLRAGGPNLDISPQAALSFALVFHELATNALKYGALSLPQGRIEVSWKVTQQPDARFVLTWSESGGPRVVEPDRRGFGTRLIKATLEGLGETKVNFEPSGMRLSLDSPLAALTHSVVPA